VTRSLNADRGLSVFATGGGEKKVRWPTGFAPEAKRGGSRFQGPLDGRKGITTLNKVILYGVPTSGRTLKQVLEKLPDNKNWAGENVLESCEGLITFGYCKLKIVRGRNAWGLGQQTATDIILSEIDNHPRLRSSIRGSAAQVGNPGSGLKSGWRRHKFQ